MTEDCRYIS